jgi:hypothetical protein
VIQELATRDIEEIRTMEAELRQKKAPKNWLAILATS